MYASRNFNDVGMTMTGECKETTKRKHTWELKWWRRKRERMRAG